jgi:hypothetical protein
MPKRIILGSMLKLNPTTISTSNIAPAYSGFQPLDGHVIPIEKNDRIEITLSWEHISGTILNQLLNIINESQKSNSRQVPTFFYNDYHYFCGEIVLLSANISPIVGTGAYSLQWNPQTKIYENHTYIPVAANVTIVIVPKDIYIYQNV